MAALQPILGQTIPKAKEKEREQEEGEEEEEEAERGEEREDAKETWRGGNGSGFREAGRDTSLNWVLAEPGLRLEGKEEAFFRGFGLFSSFPPPCSAV